MQLHVSIIVVIIFLRLVKHPLATVRSLPNEMTHRFMCCCKSAINALTNSFFEKNEIKYEYVCFIIPSLSPTTSESEPRGEKRCLLFHYFQVVLYISSISQRKTTRCSAIALYFKLSFSSIRSFLLFKMVKLKFLIIFQYLSLIV